MLDEILAQYYEELKKNNRDKNNAFDREDAMDRAQTRSLRALKRTIGPSALLPLVEEFNQRPSPTVDEARIIAYLDFCGDKSYERTYQPQETIQIIKAYEKCARVFTENNLADDKETLGRSIHDLMRGHSEACEPALDIYDKYLFDTHMVIDHVRGCMIREPKLLQKGFNVVKKSIDSYQKQKAIAEKNGKELRQDYPAYFLPVLFANLYSNFEKDVKNYGYFDTVTDNLMKLESHFETVRLWSDKDAPYNHVTFLRELSSTPFPADWPFDEETQYYGPNCWGTSYDVKRRILNTAVADAFLQKKPISEVYLPRLAEKQKHLKQMEKAERKAYLQEMRKKQHQEQKARDAETYAAIREESAKKHSAEQSDISPVFIYIGEKKPSSDQFEPIQNFKPNRNNPFAFASKPNGGLWASPIMENGHSDWENWLEETDIGEDYPNKIKYGLDCKGTKRYYLIPKPDCRILNADDHEKWQPYFQSRDYYHEDRIDYEAMSKSYDAFVLPYRVGDFSNPFRMWSVETLLVFDLNKFEIMDEREYAQYKERNQEKIEQAIKNGEDHLPMKKAGDTEYNRNLMLIRKKSKTK